MTIERNCLMIKKWVFLVVKCQVDSKVLGKAQEPKQHTMTTYIGLESPKE